MFIAHLPAAVLLSRSATFDPRASRARRAAAAFLVGSVLPDMDMLWFHLVDHGARHHHTYPTHQPAALIAGLAVVELALAAGARGAPRRRGALRATRVVGRALVAGMLLHCALDTVAGGIAWGWPVDDALHTLVVVPATRAHWILSFVLHWTFALELAITAAAVVVVARRRAPRAPSPAIARTD